MVECLVWRRGIEFSKPNFLRFAGAMAKPKGIYHWNNGNFLSCGRTFWNLYFQTPETTEMVWQDPLSRQRMQKYFQALRIKILFQTFTINHARSGTWMKLGWSLAINIKKGSKAINGKTPISLEQLLPARMQLVTIYLHFLYFPGKPDETVAVAQWARAFISQAEGWVFESQPPPRP